LDRDLRELAIVEPEVPAVGNQQLPLLLGAAAPRGAVGAAGARLLRGPIIPAKAIGSLHDEAAAATGGVLAGRIGDALGKVGAQGPEPVEIAIQRGELTARLRGGRRSGRSLPGRRRHRAAQAYECR